MDFSQNMGVKLPRKLLRIFLKLSYFLFRQKCPLWGRSPNYFDNKTIFCSIFPKIKNPVLKLWRQTNLFFHKLKNWKKKYFNSVFLAISFDYIKIKKKNVKNHVFGKNVIISCKRIFSNNFYTNNFRPNC